MLIQSFVSSLRGFWRLIILLFIVCVMSYLVLSVSNLYQQLKQHQAGQQQNLTDLLLSQTASSAGAFIQNDDADALYALATQVVNEPYVHDVTFYDNNGIQLLNTENALSMKDILTVGSPLNNQKLQFQLLTRSVIFEQQPVGFVRITFEPKYSNAWSDLQYLNNITQLYMPLIFSFLCGILFTITFINTWVKKRKSIQEKASNS